MVTVAPVQRPCGQLVVNGGTSAISEQVRALRGALLKTAVKPTESSNLSPSAQNRHEKAPDPDDHWSGAFACHRLHPALSGHLRLSAAKQAAEAEAVVTSMDDLFSHNG